MSGQHTIGYQAADGTAATLKEQPGKPLGVILIDDRPVAVCGNLQIAAMFCQVWRLADALHALVVETQPDPTERTTPAQKLADEAISHYVKAQQVKLEREEEPVIKSKAPGLIIPAQGRFGLRRP